MLQAFVLTVLLAAVLAAYLVRPAVACTHAMLLACSLFGLPGSMVALLGVIVGTPASAAVGLAGGLAASAALWALRAPGGGRANPDAGREDDEPGGGGGGPGPPGEDGGPDGSGIDWDAFEREAHAAFEGSRSSAGRSPTPAGRGRLTGDGTGAGIQLVARAEMMAG